MSKSTSIIKQRADESEKVKLNQDGTINLSAIQSLMLDPSSTLKQPSLNQHNKPLFIQMPCRLPFKLPENQSDLLKIGKLRFHKSGKIVLRIQNDEGEKIDLIVN